MLLVVSYIIFLVKILINNKEYHVKTNGNGDSSDGIVSVLEANALESNCGKHETAHKEPNLHICMSIFLSFKSYRVGDFANLCYI